MIIINLWYVLQVGRLRPEGTADGTKDEAGEHGGCRVNMESALNAVENSYNLPSVFLLIGLFKKFKPGAVYQHKHAGIFPRLD